MGEENAKICNVPVENSKICYNFIYFAFNKWILRFQKKIFSVFPARLSFYKIKWKHEDCFVGIMICEQPWMHGEAEDETTSHNREK